MSTPGVADFVAARESIELPEVFRRGSVWPIWMSVSVLAVVATGAPFPSPVFPSPVEAKPTVISGFVLDRVVEFELVLPIPESDAVEAVCLVEVREEETSACVGALCGAIP